MSKNPISLQLWSLREATREDFARTVQYIAKIGFEGVETAGYGSTSLSCPTPPKPTDFS